MTNFEAMRTTQGMQKLSADEVKKAVSKVLVAMQINTLSCTAFSPHPKKNKKKDEKRKEPRYLSYLHHFIRPLVALDNFGAKEGKA